MNENIIFKNRKKLTIIINLILIFILLLFWNNLKVLAVSNIKNSVSIEKIYANTNIGENFDDSSVIVIIDKINSGINKSHDDTIFKEVEFSEIIDLTYVSDISTIKNINDFEQILKIYLKEPSKQNVIDMINRLSLIEGIKYAGPNRIFEIEKMPNDPLYSPISSIGGQWCHNNIQSENAWDYTIGSSNVRIGVIDTGIFNHTDLNDNLAPSLDFVNMVDDEPGTGRADSDGHGTHVAGIIGAVGNQINATGVVGVNWNVTIVPMQVANSKGKIISDACVRAINYASNIWNTSERISILSMSIGGYNEWPEIETAIRNYQGLFVCSTGNKENNNDGTVHHYPSFYGSNMYTNKLQNMITVGRSDINDSRPSNANFGKNTIMLYAPGQNILSTYPEYFCTGIVRSTRRGYLLDCECTWNTYEWIPNGTTHHSNGYHYMSGSSMATPQVSGVAALLLSINPNLTTQELKTAILESVDIPNVDGINPLNNLCVTNGRLNSYNAIKYVLSNYMTPTTFTLSNYSSDVNISKQIVSNGSYFDELNVFYKLNVTYAKSYEFNVNANHEIDVILYDDNFNEIACDDNIAYCGVVGFIKYLDVGTYYLRTKMTEQLNVGTISTSIKSRNTIYLKEGENDILLNSYNNIDDYYFINNKVGFFKFNIVGEKLDGSTISYPSNIITIYNDSSKTNILQKYSLDGYINNASNKQNENDIYVYLSNLGYYYLDINYSNTNLISLKVIIEEVITKDINLFDLNENNDELISVINLSCFGDYIEKLNIKQNGKFIVSYNYSGNQSNNTLVILSKLNYNESSRHYSLDTKVVSLLNNQNQTYTYTTTLEEGIYYIGYFNNSDNSNITINLNRLITQSGSNVLVTDPDRLTKSGSQINIIESNIDIFERSYRGTNITIGFTRLIYPDYNFNVSASRLDYDWYSSNNEIAIVTKYGTVLGKSEGTVKIMAVLKEDPSKVFIKTFNIVSDTSIGIVEINNTYNVSYDELVDNKFHFNMEQINCPYPLLNNYTYRIINNCHYDTFNATSDGYGNITINGIGCFTLECTYKVNNRYKVIVHFVIE